MTAPSPLFNVGYRKEMLYVIGIIVVSFSFNYYNIEKGEGSV